MRGVEETSSRSRGVGEGVRSGDAFGRRGRRRAGRDRRKFCFVIHSAGPFAESDGFGRAGRGRSRRAIARGRARSSRDGARGDREVARARRGSGSGAPGGLHAAGGGRGGRDGGEADRALAGAHRLHRNRLPGARLGGGARGEDRPRGEGGGHAGEHHGGHLVSAFAGERRASKVPRGGAARARPGSGENDATLPPARRARYPPARIFHQSRGLPRATAPGCQRGCRADLAGHDPGRNGQTHSIARLRRDRDPKPILYEPIDPPGVPRSGRNRGHLSSTSTPALEFSVGEKDTARHPRKYLPGIGKSVSRTTFWKLGVFVMRRRTTRVPISRGAAKPPRRARGRRARGPRARRARGDHAPRDRAGRRCARDPLETERRARDRRSIAPLPQRPRAVPAVRRRAARSNLAPPRRRASADRVPRRTADRTSRRPPPSRSSPPRPAPSRAAPAAVTTPRDARIPRRATDRTWGSREIPSRRARARWRATAAATTPAPRDPPRAMSTPPPRAPPRTARVPGATRGPRRTDEADEAARVGSRVARHPRAARPERPPTAAPPRTSPPCPRHPPSSSTSGRGARSRRGPPRRRTRR